MKGNMIEFEDTAWPGEDRNARVVADLQREERELRASLYSAKASITLLGVALMILTMLVIALALYVGAL